MSILNRLMGNASEVDAAEVQAELLPILADSESVVQVFKLVRDLIVFTQYRILYIDKQGMTGKKIDYHTVPYKAITQVKVETSGHFDMDCELKVWVSGQDDPVKIELKAASAQSVQKTLANQMFLLT